jgi:hypothetical protein
MKNLIVTFIAAILCWCSSAAQGIFTLTPDGFQTSDGAEYIVIENNKTAGENYSLLKSVLNQCIPPDDENAIEETDNAIVISSYTLGLFKLKCDMISDYIMDYKYSIKFMYKDGKIRINAPIVKFLGSIRIQEERMVVYGDPKIYPFLKKHQFLYDFKTRKLKNPKAKAAIETNTNNLLNKIIKELSSQEDEW